MSSLINRVIKHFRAKKVARVTKLLLHNDKSQGFWPWLEQGKVTKKEANKFFLGAILDYQIPADKAWENARRLTEDIFKDPEDLWGLIVSLSLEEWMKRFSDYSLHRFPKAHERVWRIGNDLVRSYNSDARNVWIGKSANEVIDCLNELKVGEQLARMIVGALIDTGQIEGVSDVKADIHVTRVLGRVFKGERFSPKEAVDYTRKMMPENPWTLDQPLFWLGKTLCSSTPKCFECYLSKECMYYNSR